MRSSVGTHPATLERCVSMKTLERQLKRYNAERIGIYTICINPFVVSLSNHERLDTRVFDKLRPNGKYLCLIFTINRLQTCVDTNAQSVGTMKRDKKIC